MSAGNGKKASSTSSAGVIQLRAPTTTGGASRSSNASCVILAANVCRTRAALAGVGRQQDLAGLLDRFEHLLVVERDDRAGVDDLAAEMPYFCFQRFGGIERAVQRGADGQDRQVVAGLLDIRLADRDFVVARRHAARSWNVLGLIVERAGSRRRSPDRCRPGPRSSVPWHRRAWPGRRPSGRGCARTALSSPASAARRIWCRPTRAAPPASSAARRTSTATWRAG